MEKKFSDYFELLRLTPIVIKRIEDIYQFFNSFCSEPIEDILITDFINKDSTREFESLWFFSKNYWMEAKSFRLKDDFDISPLTKIGRIQFTKVDYEYKKPTSKSNIYIRIDAADMITGEFKATGENCDKTIEIVEKYIKPKLK